MSCFAIESDIGPLSWRCNGAAGHYPDTDHAFTVAGKAHHSWREDDQ